MQHKWILWIGDGIVIGLVTITGFVMHGELASAGLRILTTFIPLLAAWIIVAVPGRLFDASLALQPRQMWRPLWAMAMAGPLAVLLRSLMLGGLPILPIFALVLTGVTSASIFLWRWVYYFLFRTKD